MALSEVAAGVLRTLLLRERDDLIEESTDALFAESVDLAGSAQRATTRSLVRRVVAGNEAALLDGDEAGLDALVALATSMRSESEFHVSTLLRGFRSFRRGLEAALRRAGCDGWTAFEVLAAADDLFARTAFRAADEYSDKLHATIQQRRRDLELTLATERDTLIALSSPILPVWPGIVMAPVIGEITGERADRIEADVLRVVMERDVRVVLFDLTGMAAADEEAVDHLARMARATRLLGAEPLLVGIGPSLSKTFVKLGADLGNTRTFATLHDGLRAALAEAGYRVMRAR